MQHNEPLLYREQDALKVLGLGRTKLRQLLVSGEIPSFHVGRARLIPADGVRAWIDGHLQEGSAVKLDPHEFEGHRERAA